MRRPLKDLELTRFLDVPSVSRKRPLSPGEALLSPAKRRILNQEGIYKDVLYGPNSPAKRLDFGSPSTMLKSTTSFDDDEDDDDNYFSQPSTSSMPSSSTPIPSQTPPPVDPQSVHYPGFTIYYDIEPITMDDAPPHAESEKDASKENIPPRKKTRSKGEATPKSMLNKRESERLKKAKSSPSLLTPEKSFMSAKAGSPTPRRTIFGQTVDSTPRGRENMRKLLQNEADNE